MGDVMGAAAENVFEFRAKRKPSAPDPKNRVFQDAAKAHKAWLGHEGAFVAHTPELLASSAWRAMSLHARRVIDLLELEHMAHRGTENAYLKLPWRQMRAAGIGSDFIINTITEVETLGLITVTHRGGHKGGARQNPSLYKINYLPWKFVPATGPAVYYAPTNEWREHNGKTGRPKSNRMHRTGGPF
jgi:hypothetical protein